MITINLNTQENVKLTLFPDNQPHVNIVEGQGHRYNVVCSLTDSMKLLELCMVADAIDHRDGLRHTLIIPYLMGARYDRVMAEGDSFDLKVIAKIINSLGFNFVELFDPHSDVAPALIESCIVKTNKILVEQYDKPNAVLIVPDGGAEKKAMNYQKWNSNISDVIHCIKHRDVKDGSISLEVLVPEECTGRNCVIVDDICDGGRTFIEIAKQIMPYHYDNLTLIVSHGIFSKGFSELEQYFDEIITSNSYRGSYNSNRVKVVNL